jgi:hypothetical protein
MKSKDKKQLVQCNHNDPSTVKMNSLQPMNFTKEFTCNGCGKLLVKHMYSDKDFINKYNEIYGNNYENCNHMLNISECDHNDPKNLIQKDLQPMDYTREFICKQCDKLVIKHIEKDKEFIEKFNKSTQVVKLIREYANGEREYSLINLTT